MSVSQVAASNELMCAVRMRCLALAGVESLARPDALTDRKWVRASLQALIAPLDRDQLRSAITWAGNVLGKERGRELIEELWGEEEVFDGLAEERAR